MVDARIFACTLDSELKGNGELFSLIASELSNFFRKTTVEAESTETEEFKNYNLNSELQEDLNDLKDAVEALESPAMVKENN